MTNQELYKQAILDAKAVRETALAAAKESLSEAFEPRIMEMMRLKLAEELEENIDEVDEATEMEESMEKMENESMMKQEEGSEMVDEAALDEILAELNALSEEMEASADQKEAKDGLNEADEEADDDDAQGGDDSMEADSDDNEGPVSDDDEVIELSVGELKQIFRDAFTQAQGAGAPADMAGTLDAEAEMEMGGMPGGMDELSLEEILAELEEEDSKMEEAMNPGAEATHKGAPGGYAKAETKVEEMRKDLNEANMTITALKAELNEINLLNAKLLYFNKVLKAKSLNESQKVKVMNAFDRAVTVKEVENTYRTLSESITAPKKTALKESMGFASKPIGTAPAKPIVEADAFVSRWQTLAGIK